MDYLDNTKKDAVVLDVAGGKGELAWELINLTGVKHCVVVDPRPLNLALCRSKWEKGLFEPRRTGPVFSKWYPACEDGCRLRKPKTPGHLRCFFDGDAFSKFINAEKCQGGEDNDNEVSRIENTAESNRWFQRELRKAKHISWTTKGLLQHEDGASYHHEEENVLDSNGHETTSTEITDPSDARNVLQRCHLIVGFHPDQAAGEIAEFASAAGIPWCIVPCCVYSDSFPRRRLKNGTKVKTYDDLVQWLREKDLCAKVASLDLEGKNKVVYMLPHVHV